MKVKPLIIGDLKIEIPIIQGGMGVGVSGAKLASAVANEGGVGVISGAQIGYREPDFFSKPFEANVRALRKEIQKAKSLTPKGILGVNLMVAMQNYAQFCRVAVEEKIDMIISGAGIPLDLPEYVKGSTVKIVPIVSSVRGAKLIIRRWKKKFDREPDAIVVEGAKAGGHLGFTKEDLDEKKTEKLPKIVSDLYDYLQSLNLNIPIIAAGGIYNKEDIMEVVDSGADGVQIGTRFVVTEECDASDAYKQAYLDAKEEDIQIMMSPVGLPGRALNNPFLKRVAAEGRVKVEKCFKCVHKCDPASTPFCITQALVDAVKGNVDQGLVFVGANAYKADKITTVRQIMDELKSAF